MERMTILPKLEDHHSITLRSDQPPNWRFFSTGLVVMQSRA
jgi:hypothetical protein